MSRDFGADRFHPSVGGLGGRAKRAFDLIFALAGVIVISPLLLLSALLVRVCSPGPIFFHQSRLGFRGRPFVLLKLRSMCRDAEKDRGPTWSAEGDPRCTPIGGVLRRLGIDELPQLLNVLKGEMSLVGPRPERPEFHRLFREHYPGFEQRLGVRGGITGLAQIRGWRGDTSIEERLRCDQEYLRRWSFWLDLWILLQTPLAIWRGRQHPSSTIPALREHICLSSR